MTTTRSEAPAKGSSLLGSLSRLGIGLVSLFVVAQDSAGRSGGKSGPVSGGVTAGSGEKTPSAGVTAAGAEELEVNSPYCCSLYYPNGPFCPYFGGWRKYFYCPSGYYKQWWYCCYGTTRLGCGECTTSPSTCWSGNFRCSQWWVEGSC